MADGGSKVVSQATIDVLLNTEAGDCLAQQKTMPLPGADAGNMEADPSEGYQLQELRTSSLFP